MCLAEPVSLTLESCGIPGHTRTPNTKRHIYQRNRSNARVSTGEDHSLTLFALDIYWQESVFCAAKSFRLFLSSCTSSPEIFECIWNQSVNCRWLATQQLQTENQMAQAKPIFCFKKLENAMRNSQSDTIHYLFISKRLLILCCESRLICPRQTRFFVEFASLIAFGVTTDDFDFEAASNWTPRNWWISVDAAQMQLLMFLGSDLPEIWMSRVLWLWQIQSCSGEKRLFFGKCSMHECVCTTERSKWCRMYVETDSWNGSSHWIISLLLIVMRGHHP